MVANFVPLVAVMARGAISVAVATQPAKNLNWSVNPEVPHVPNNETFAHDSGLSNAVQLCAARRMDDAPVSPVTSTLGQNRAAYYRYAVAGHSPDPRRYPSLQPRRSSMVNGENHRSGGVYRSGSNCLSTSQRESAGASWCAAMITVIYIISAAFSKSAWGFLLHLT